MNAEALFRNVRPMGRLQDALFPAHLASRRGWGQGQPRWQSCLEHSNGDRHGVLGECNARAAGQQRAMVLCDSLIYCVGAAA
jgi:hypothetical protein